MLGVWGLLGVVGCYDVDARGVPPIAVAHVFDPEAIGRVSLFRSSEGHDYSDSQESCRSMKHYFAPRGLAGGETLSDPLPVASPVSGVIRRVRSESNAQDEQLWIEPDEAPAFRVVLFHVETRDGLAVGQRVEAGEVLGGVTRISDVAMWVHPFSASRLVSLFDAMPDAIFADWQARGVEDRDALILSREARDADPLRCDGEAFLTAGTLPAWVTLDAAPPAPG